MFLSDAVVRSMAKRKEGPAIRAFHRVIGHEDLNDVLKLLGRRRA